MHPPSTIVTGTGSALPRRTVSNDMIAQRLDTSDRWVHERLGIRERHIADTDESTGTLATLAGRRACEAAGVDPATLDLIILATTTPDRQAPATACAVQAALGSKAAAFDLAAVCSGFLYGLSTANAYIEARRAQRVLVIGADTFSRITNWDDRSCVFFGDGAGAAVLEAGRPGEGFLSLQICADGTGLDGFTVPGPQSATSRSPHFQMDGRSVFDTATRVLPEAILSALAEAGVRPRDVDLVVPHQPSVRILRQVADDVGIPFDRFVTTMAHTANTAGASVGIALDHAVRQSAVHHHSIVVFTAVGSGWTWGAGVMRWVTADRRLESTDHVGELVGALP